MKFNNYIFTGFGMSKGKYKITNDDIFYAIEKEFLFEFPEANEFEIYYILDNKIVNNK